MRKLLALPITLALLSLWAIDAPGTSIYNPTSAFDHFIDGTFTSSEEWSDITPHDVEWAHVYFDYDGDFLYIMNDWIVNNEDHPTGGLIDGDYNQFIFESDYAKWELRIYSDQTIGLWEWDADGNRVEKTDTSDILAAYGWGSSPNLSAAHTLWEVQLDLSEPGTNSYEINWNNYYNMLVVLRDPHPNQRNLVNRIKAPPKAQGGFRVHVQNGPGPGQTGVQTIPEIPEPVTAILFAGGTAGLAWFKRGRGN